MPTRIHAKGLSPSSGKQKDIGPGSHPREDGSDASERIPHDQEIHVGLEGESSSDSDESMDSDSDSTNSHSTQQPDVPRPGTKGMRSIRTFYGKSNRRIDIICSPSDNPITPLRFFCSSLLMNFLTPDGCVCGFPSATLSRLGVLRMAAPSLRDRLAVIKYEKRGFDFQADDLRDLLDMWDYLFFGQRNLLAMDFRVNLADDKAVLPILYTLRGWVPNHRWLS